MSLNKKISLIHIGLTKTATTAMQNLWLKDPNVSLVHRGLLQIVQKARVTGRDTASGLKIPLKWQYDTKPEDNQQIVMSQEALSTAYINERASKKDIAKFQQTAAKLASQIAPGAKILITVRQPETWIKSIYNQAVKQGGIDTFPEFLKLELPFIEQSLDITSLVETWGNFFGQQNILVLPIELMRKNKSSFFNEIYNFSNVPAPDLAHELHADPSMKESHLRLMRKFNEWVELFCEHGVYQGHPPPQAKQALDIIRFAVRYSLESPSSILEEQVSPVEMTLPDCGIDTAAIDSDLLSKVKRSYESFIGNNNFWGFRNLYCDLSDR